MLSSYGFDLLALGMGVCGAATAVSLTLGNMYATYGRYTDMSRLAKISLPSRVAWFTQELPSVVVPVYLLWTGELTRFWHVGNCLVIMLFLIHYVQRTFLFSLCIVGGKRTPVHVWVLGMLFCTVNGYMQAGYHGVYARYGDVLYWEDNRVYLGLLLFCSGMVINIHSDHVLRNLRKPGETGYKIPQGGMFEFVSGANFLGEIIEWIGYAIVARSWTGWAFAFFTAANIGPRALSHHRWYQQKFEDYPTSRRALIPFIL